MYKFNIGDSVKIVTLTPGTSHIGGLLGQIGIVQDRCQEFQNENWYRLQVGTANGSLPESCLEIAPIPSIKKCIINGCLKQAAYTLTNKPEKGPILCTEHFLKNEELIGKIGTENKSNYCDECGFHLDNLHEVNPTCPGCETRRTRPQDLVEAVKILLRTAAHAHQTNIKYLRETIDDMEGNPGLEAVKRDLVERLGAQADMLIDVKRIQKAFRS